MRRKRRSATLVLLVMAWGAVAPLSGAAAQCQYEAVLIYPPLDPLGGAPTGTAINEQGHICGHYDLGISGYDDSFIALDGAMMTTLMRPPELLSAEAQDIADLGGFSDQGLIVGTVVVDNRGFRAFSHDGAAFTVLPPVTIGNALAFGEAIDNALRVIGASQDTDNQLIYAVYWEGAKPREIPTTVMPYGWATDVTSDGLVVGWMGQAPWAGEADAFTYDTNTGSLVNLGRPDGAMSVRPFAINDVGEFTGLVYWGVPGKDTPTPSAFLFSKGEWTFLGVFDPVQYEHTWPRDMNSQGQIVGVLEGLGPGKGFLWQNGELFMLNDLLVASSKINVIAARGINDSGQITGSGYDPDGGAVILTPIAPQGDLTLDCIVGPADLAQLLAQWGQCPTKSKCMADIAPANGDGTVGPIDLAVLLANWG